MYLLSYMYTYYCHALVYSNVGHSLLLILETYRIEYNSRCKHTRRHTAFRQGITNHFPASDFTSSDVLHGNRFTVLLPARGVHGSEAALTQNLYQGVGLVEVDFIRVHCVIVIKTLPRVYTI